MYIYDDCGNAIPTPACEVCGDSELGRIRSAGFIRSDVTIADPTDPTDWSGPIAAGTVLVIPNTQGEFDGGTAKIVPGYGQVHERRISSLFKLKFIDPNYIGNAQFYNSIQKDFNWKPFFVTETQVHLADRVAAIVPKAAVQNDDESEVVWEVECSWVSNDLPLPYDVPADTFVCEG